MASNVFIVDKKPGNTYTVDSTNVATGITAGVLIDGSLGAIKGIFISVEANPIRIAYGVAPIQDGVGVLGHIVKADGVLKISSNEAITAFKYISKVADAHATLMITPIYAT
jgi:hypothetical protein